MKFLPSCRLFSELIESTHHWDEAEDEEALVAMLASYSQERFLVHHMMTDGMLWVAHDKTLHAHCVLQSTSAWNLDLVSRLRQIPLASLLLTLCGRLLL